MTRRLVALAVEAAQMVARGEDEVFRFVAEATAELFGADGGVGFSRWKVEAHGGLTVHLTTGGVPPLPAAWVERVKEAAPRVPSTQAFGRVGVTEPIRVSDLLDLRRFWGTEEFEVIHGVHGGRYPLGAAFVHRPDELVFLGMHRVKRDFADDDVANLRELQRILTEAFAFRRMLDDAVDRLAAAASTHLPPARPGLWYTGPAEYRPTRRETEVLALVAAGWTNQRIASHLGITERTVRKHLGSVYEQAEVSGRAAAVSWWRGRRSRT